MKVPPSSILAFGSERRRASDHLAHREGRKLIRRDRSGSLFLFPPGGAYDAVGRPWADKMKHLLGTVVVENIGGASGSLGCRRRGARPSLTANTILLGGTLPHVNEALLKSRPLYDPVKDLDPIASVAANFLCIAVHPAVPAQSLKELIDYAKANPGKLSYGHAVSARCQHLTGECSNRSREHLRSCRCHIGALAQ